MLYQAKDAAKLRHGIPAYSNLNAELISSYLLILLCTMTPSSFVAMIDLAVNSAPPAGQTHSSGRARVTSTQSFPQSASGVLREIIAAVFLGWR